jgi:hypothetical protein
LTEKIKKRTLRELGHRGGEEEGGGDGRRRGEQGPARMVGRSSGTGEVAVRTAGRRVAAGAANLRCGAAAARGDGDVGSSARGSSGAGWAAAEDGGTVRWRRRELGHLMEGVAR